MDTNNNVIEIKKISVSDYLRDNTLLEVKYLPFDVKLDIVSQVINNVIKSVGGLNQSLLRRVSTDIFIESITNIDMGLKDENDLEGFDQLCFHGELDNFINALGNEYQELVLILNERVNDYIRIETNPSVTIMKIYEQVTAYMGQLLDSISEYIQNVDVEKLSDELMPLIKSVVKEDES